MVRPTGLTDSPSAEATKEGREKPHSPNALEEDQTVLDQNEFTHSVIQAGLMYGAMILEPQPHRHPAGPIHDNKGSAPNHAGRQHKKITHLLSISSHTAK